MRIFVITFLVVIFIQVGPSVRADQDVRVTPVMKAATTIGGQKLEYPDTQKAEMTSIIVEIPPGKESGLHKHPVPTYVQVLEGTLTVDLANGSHQQFETGSGFLEDIGVWHNVKNSSRVTLKFLVVFAGLEGTSNLIRPDPVPASATAN